VRILRRHVLGLALGEDAGRMAAAPVVYAATVRSASSWMRSLGASAPRWSGGVLGLLRMAGAVPANFGGTTRKTATRGAPLFATYSAYPRAAGTTPLVMCYS
jgi:hypothetical protein